MGMSTFAAYPSVWLRLVLIFIAASLAGWFAVESAVGSGRFHERDAIGVGAGAFVAAVIMLRFAASRSAVTSRVFSDRWLGLLGAVGFAFAVHVYTLSGTDALAGAGFYRFVRALVIFRFADFLWLWSMFALAVSVVLFYDSWENEHAPKRAQKEARRHQQRAAVAATPPKTPVARAREVLRSFDAGVGDTGRAAAHLKDWFAREELKEKLGAALGPEGRANSRLRTLLKKFGFDLD